METFFVAGIIGIGIGILSGLLGIGGGTVMVPVFRLGFGMTAIQATATSLFTIIPTSLAGCINHIRNHTCIISLGLAAGVAGACLSPVGVYLASISPSWAIMLAAAVIIGYSAFSMLKKGLRRPPAPVVEVLSPEAPYSVIPDAHANGASPKGHSAESAPDDACSMGRRQLVAGAAAGLIAGLASGYVGVGGGFIMVPLFISLAGISMKKASGTSLVAVTILAIPGTIEQMIMGNVMVSAGIAMAVGSIPGALVGANLVKRIPERTLRLAFGCVLLCVAVLLAVNEFLAPMAA